MTEQKKDLRAPSARTASMKLAIVGSVSLAGNEQAQRIIEAVLDRYRPSLVISGGAVGVDTMAVARAAQRGIPVKVHLPRVPRWHDGFRPRNLLIAKDCDRLVRITAKDSRTYGSGWTRDRAKEMGKPTEEYVVDVVSKASARQRPQTQPSDSKG